MPVWTIDLMLQNLESKNSVPEYATAVASKLDKVLKVVRHNFNDAWSASCKWYSHKVKPKYFEEGQSMCVYYRCPRDIH